MIFIWLGLIIVLILLKITTKNLVFVWFIASAIISLILSIFLDYYIIQFLVFIILGFILYIKKHDWLIKLTKEKQKLNNKKREKNEK